MITTTRDLMSDKRQLMAIHARTDKADHDAVFLTVSLAHWLRQVENLRIRVYQSNQENAALKEQQAEACIYTKETYGDNYWTCNKCDAAWVLEAGDPYQNEMNFCPGCGRKVETLAYCDGEGGEEGGDPHD